MSDYLKRAKFTRKPIVDEHETYINEESLNLVRQYCTEIETIPMERRVYMDESFIYNNEAPKRGRSLKKTMIPRVRSRHGKRWTVYLAIRQDGLVHPPILSQENADDVEFYHYVWRTLVPNLRPGEVVIWDRIGKAGRCANPSKEHYNPGAIKLIENAGCRVMFLPPKGKFFNPIELVFGCMKVHLRNDFHNTLAYIKQRPRTEDEAKENVERACGKINHVQIGGFFRERANTRAFRKHYPEIDLR